MPEDIAPQDATAPAFTHHRRDRVQHEDGRRANHFYLVDALGGEHLAAVGEERDTRDGHYLYRAMPPFDATHPESWGNAGSVVEWLHSLVGQRADALGESGNGGDSAPIKWQQAAGKEGGEKPEPAAARTKPNGALVTAAGLALDSWPPPPPPERRQLPLPVLPIVELPKPPAQPAPRTAEEIRAAGAAARAAALGGLLARAETEAGTRAAARRAAADWLRGDLPEEEVELLRANIAGLAETLREIDTMPLAMQQDTPSELPNGVHNGGNSASQPGSGGGFLSSADGAQCNGVAVDCVERSNAELELRVARARLVTEALDYLREIGSSYLPLRVQAGTHAVAAIAAAARHGDPAVALLAREYLRALHEVAEAHLAVLSSREYTADPRAGLAARLPMLAAVADAVVDAEAGQALAAQRAAVAAAMAVRPPRPPAAPGGGPQQQPQQQQPWASAPKQPAGSADQAGVSTGGGDSYSLSQDPSGAGQEAASSFSPAIGGLDGKKKLTTKPRTPHPKNLLKSAAAASARAAASGSTPGGPPPQQQPLAATSPAGGTSHLSTTAAASGGAGAASEGCAGGGGAAASGGSRPGTAGGGGGAPRPGASGGGGSDSEVDEWHESDAEGEGSINLLDGEPNAGPLGNALKVLGKGKGCLQACRFGEVPSMVRAIVDGALAQLQRSDAWHVNANFVRSFQEKVAAMQKEAGRLSREKAPSTNRKAKQSVIKIADAMKQSVDSLSAKQSASQA